MPHLREVVEAMLYRYAAVIDDGDLAEWPGFFAEEGEYKLIPRENFLRGLPVALIYCKNRAMMRDRVIAIKKASVYTPHYYRHLYGNVLIERTGPQVTLRANYLVCRTQDDGDSTVFSTGRLIAALSVPEDLSPLTIPPPSSWTPKSDPISSDALQTRVTGFDAGPQSISPRTVRGMGMEPTPASIPPRSFSSGPSSIPPRSFSSSGPPTMSPRSLAYGSSIIPPGMGSELPPTSRRRATQGPLFLSMVVIYDTCRIPGLLVFPI